MDSSALVEEVNAAAYRFPAPAVQADGKLEWDATTMVLARCVPHLTAPVAVATPNIRHIGWFADHDRIESTFLDGALDPEGGTVRPRLGDPGHGMRFKGQRRQAVPGPLVPGGVP